MKKISIFALACIVSVQVIAQKKAKSPVEGRIYSITMTEPDKKKSEPFKDEFSFIVNAKFKSTFMVNAGFAQCDYEIEVDSSATPPNYHFTVEAKTENQERFSWDATISNDAVEGTAIIRKKGKIEHSYTFTGAWKNKKKPKPAPKAPAAPVVPDSTKKTE